MMADIEYIENNIEDILKNIESRDINERDKLIAIDIFLHKKEELYKELSNEELIKILRWLLHTAYYI